MQNFKNQFDQFTLDRLRNELLKKIGWSVSTKPDCAKLSDIIVESGCGYISESTLYRFFFQFEKHKPYKSTIDILCQFLDYKNSDEFFEKLAEDRLTLHCNGINTLSNRGYGLLFFCIENSSKLPLLDFFEEVKELPHQFKTDVSIAVFDSLLKTTQQDWFFNEFAQQHYVREYFFEKGHDTKFRIKNYDIAYLKYLESVSRDKDVQHFQDYLFGNCVLFRHYYINQKSKEALAHGNFLYKKNIGIDANKIELHIYPLIRYEAYKIWYLEITYAKLSHIEEHAMYLIDTCKQIKTRLDMVEQKILFHTVAEAFVYSGLPESFHWELKAVFKDAYKRLPELVYFKHLKYSLPYFDENRLLNFRP